MEKVSFGSALIVAIENATGMHFIWFLVLAFFVVVEVVLRLIPTNGNASILNKFLGFVQKIIDGLIPDKKK